MKAMKTAVAMPKVQLSKKAQKAAQRYLDGVGISLDLPWRSPKTGHRWSLQNRP